LRSAPPGLARWGLKGSRWLKSVWQRRGCDYSEPIHSSQLRRVASMMADVPGVLMTCVRGRPAFGRIAREPAPCPSRVGCLFRNILTSLRKKDKVFQQRRGDHKTAKLYPKIRVEGNAVVRGYKHD